MGKLFKFVFQILASVILIFVFAAVLVVVDGTTDQGRQAEVGLVLGGSPVPAEGADPLLDRTVKLYQSGAFASLIVASTLPRSADEPAAMAKYLEAHGVPEDAIIRDSLGDTSPAISHSVAVSMKARSFKSVMIVSEYYRIVLVKVALYHEGLTQIGKAHVGKFKGGDIPAIVRETVELYRFISVTYLFPAAEKLREEAQSGGEQVKADAEKAKTKVDKGLDSLPK